eukprot:gene3686-4242_t
MGFPSHSLKVTALKSEADAYTNRVSVNPADFKSFLVDSGNPGQVRRENTTYVTINEIYVLSVQESNDIPVGMIGLSKAQRQLWMRLGLSDVLNVAYYDPENLVLASLTFKIDYFITGKRGPKFDCKLISAQLSRDYNNQYFTEGQVIIINHLSQNLKIEVSKIQLTPESGNPANHQGLLLSTTQILLQKAENATIDIDSTGPLVTKILFKQDWDFENMGIGGLDNEFRDIFRRAFASRIFPPAIVAKLGVQHVKGILLFGPPGTGKTLIARQIGKMLNGREPKIVSGPEVLGRYVGESEENIRKLFKDAELEYKQKGDESALHIIIFDEIDSICKTRGTKTGDTGVNDSIVNQLLAKIEGVESLNNILIIGMTNRKDMIDDALLRPGRLEVHVEISLPDEHGREQIFKIHTSKMTTNKLMASDVNLKHLANVTKNYSGAEIEGVVKAATSYAFSRQVDTKNIKNVQIKPEDLNVNADDFERALDDIKPAFGCDDEQFRNYAINGIINYGHIFEKINQSGTNFINQVKNSNRTPLVSILLAGKPGSGKSSLATSWARNSDFPFVRIISPDDLVGFTETAKASKITKRTPPPGKKLLVLATTSNQEAMRDLGLNDCFATFLPVPSITKTDEFKKVLQSLEVFSPQDLDKAASVCFSEDSPITVKQMIMVVEMARQEPGNLINNLKQAMEDFTLRNF